MPCMVSLIVKGKSMIKLFGCNEKPAFVASAGTSEVGLKPSASFGFASAASVDQT